MGLGVLEQGSKQDVYSGFKGPKDPRMREVLGLNRNSHPIGQYLGGKMMIRVLGAGDKVQPKGSITKGLSR